MPKGFYTVAVEGVCEAIYERSRIDEFSLEVMIVIYLLKFATVMIAALIYFPLLDKRLTPYWTNRVFLLLCGLLIFRGQLTFQDVDWCRFGAYDMLAYVGRPLMPQFSREFLSYLSMVTA